VPTSKIQILIEADDKASAKLRALAAGMQEVDDKSKKTAGTWEKLKTVGLQAAAVVGTLTVAVYAGKKAYDATIGAVVDYNKAILDSARSAGIATDEFSRIVQVADDFGISMGDVETALALATKNGFAPSVDSIAGLADRLNKMPDPTKRAAEAARIFGRNWAALDPLLQAGGKSIRDMSAAVADGLVVTEAEAQATERYRIQLDQLNDTWTAVKNEVGQDAIPLLTEKLGIFNEMLQGNLTILDAWASTLGVNTANLQALRDAEIQATDTARWQGLADSFIVQAESAEIAQDALSDLSAQALLTAAAEAIMAGDRSAANHLIELWQQAKETADEMERLMNLIQATSGGFTAEMQAQAGIVRGGGVQEGFQHGGSFVVPGQGSGDRPFLMNLSPGELVRVIPKSEVNNSRSMTFNGGVNINNGMDRQSMESMFRSFLGGE